MAKRLNSNDAIILKLKTEIAEKKKNIKGAEKFTPKTNCSLMMEGERINLHAASLETLTLALVKLNALRMSAEDLPMDLDVKIQGHALEDWLDDLQSKILVVNKTKEEDRLKVLESKLTDLLSADKKTELLIEELQGLI